MLRNIAKSLLSRRRSITITLFDSELSKKLAILQIIGSKAKQIIFQAMIQIKLHKLILIKTV
jgi:hypothetical protein